MLAPTKILVVDDSALYRTSIQNVLRDVDHVKVVGTAKNGVEALEKIDKLQPDLLTLDVQMPDMDGIEVLNEIKRRKLKSKAIMVSSYTSQGAQVTTDALMQGAFDFILKPTGTDSLVNRQNLKNALEQKIVAFRDSDESRQCQSSLPDIVSSADDDSLAVLAATNACRAVIIGTSTGGPEALRIILPKLPKNLPVPILVVQHMPAKYTHSLAKRLNQICELDVVEGEQGMEAIAGQIVIAPGGRQMKMAIESEKMLLRITDDPAENGVRPCVDYLLRSAVTELDGNALAVILTGMGRDGREGCRLLKAQGGFVFAQSQQQCVVYGMPKSVIVAGLADRILPLGRIAPGIVRHVKNSRRSPGSVS